MMTSDDKVGGWVKKGQNHDDVILECPLMRFTDLYEETIREKNTNTYKIWSALH